jgi:hypothetical protein
MADLAHGERVQRRPEALGDPGRDLDPSACEADDHDSFVGALEHAGPLELVREQLSRLAAVGEAAASKRPVVHASTVPQDRARRIR